MEIIPSKDRSQFSQVKYQFFLDAPFEISNYCCTGIKKWSAHAYQSKTKRFPITAQTAAESRLRTQVWLREGCNAFTAEKKISNPMSFWTEQDVLLYIKLNNVEISEEYGEVVFSKEQGQLDGQMRLADFELFDLDKPELECTGNNRTGCMTCGYGLHLDKHPTRLDRMHKKYPKYYDWIMRGGAFDTDGLWKPKAGLGMWFVFEWCNVHGDMGYELPDMDKYKEKYSTQETDYWLKPESSWFENKLKAKVNGYEETGNKTDRGRDHEKQTGNQK